MDPAPRVTFYRLIEEAAAPRRADRSGLGSLPTRAFRHCDAVTSAAGFGWHLCPPIDFELLWDGGAGLVALRRAWRTGCRSAPRNTRISPPASPPRRRPGIGDYAPPFLTALQEPGVVQVWTGLAARTAPGWSLLVRDLANLPRHPGYAAL